MQQAEACSEIFVNKRFLEDLLQTPVDHFAYLFGGKSACGQREAILVQDEGYKTAVTTHHGCVFERHLQSPHLLSRIGIAGSAGLLASLTCSPADCLQRFRPPRQSKH
jgi:peptidoglycan/xylan/chitin deacetylase (PgdA/CDA1 family)